MTDEFRNPDEHSDRPDSLCRVREEMLPECTIRALSSFYKTVGDPTRIRILAGLLARELCVCDIARLLDMNLSAVSHQLRVLKEADLVRSRRDGKTVFYSLADDHVRLIIHMGLDHIREKENEENA